MSRERRISDELKFIETCVENDLLKQTDAETLRQAVVDDEAFASQESVKLGLLTASDVDIVHSLRNPMNVVPGYEILGLVGRGGMGVVYRARQLDLDRIVALKTVLISNVSSPTAAARFEREAKTLARLQHPNIVQALSFGQHLGRYYFAMEFVTGRSCEQALRQERILDPATVWGIVRQVASGLLHALRQKVIHRDIKPANLLMLPAPEGSTEYGGREVVKITDFGLAMFADSDPDQMRLTTGDKIMGSPAYMSPEQFGGDSVDFRSDIYSLGATAWHLMFGTPPFQGKNLGSLLSQKSVPLTADRQSMPVEIPADQWALLMEMLDPDEEKRPPSYEVLIDRIDELGVAGSIHDDSRGGSSSISATHPISEQLTMEATTPKSNGAATTGTATTGTATAGTVTGTAAGSPALSPTLEIKSDAVVRPSTHRRRITWLVGTAVVLVLAGIVGWGVYQANRSQRGPRLYTRIIGDIELYDGESLVGWDVGGSSKGGWNALEAPDKSTAIVCTTDQGAVTRRLGDEPRPRVSVFVWPQEGFSKVDIDFAVDPNGGSDLRGSLRFTPEQVMLGQKTEDFGELARVIRSSLPPRRDDRGQVVHIERQPSDWYVFLEEQFVGSIPIDRIGDELAIRIVVHAPTESDVTLPVAYFTDVRMERLADRDPDKLDPNEADANASNADESDAGEPDAGEPDAGEPDADEPDADEPDADEPDAGESDAS